MNGAKKIADYLLEKNIPLEGVLNEGHQYSYYLGWGWFIILFFFVVLSVFIFLFASSSFFFLHQPFCLSYSLFCISFPSPPPAKKGYCDYALTVSANSVHVHACVCLCFS
jgi:hypothetical protein